eukprot:4196754-Amphidinium_carterae.1
MMRGQRPQQMIGFRVEPVGADSEKKCSIRGSALPDHIRWCQHHAKHQNFPSWNVLPFFKSDLEQTSSCRFAVQGPSVCGRSKTCFERFGKPLTR